jgi:prevent-host-death family protein
MATWTVAAAKARFSELIDKAQHEGPQAITRRGKNAAVIVSAEEWEHRRHRSGDLAQFFAESPLRGSRLDIARLQGGVRNVGL